MATDNTVTLIGNLTDDPELRFTPNGAAVANFRLAVTPRVKRRRHLEGRGDSFFRINCWRQLAENVTESLSKGTRAMVDRPAALAVLGDRRGREALRRRGRGRGGRPLAEVGHRQGRADQRQGGRRRQQGRPVQRRAAVLAGPTRWPRRGCEPPGA